MTTSAYQTNITPEIGLEPDQRQALIKLLNTVLADENLIYHQTRSAHWNITGPHFFALHELLEEQYNELKLLADEIAERAVMLGGRANGTMTSYLNTGRLEEPADFHASWREVIDLLRRSHEKMAALLRENIDQAAGQYGDEGTADLLVAALRTHEKMGWMLRATLNG